MPKYKYTVIKREPSGAPISTHHYEVKADALCEVAAIVSLGYRVEFMEWSTWFVYGGEEK